MLTFIIVFGVITYIAIGVIFHQTFAWCLGMPASSCRTPKDKAIKFLAEWSMILGYPFWIIFMVGVLIAGK